MKRKTIGIAAITGAALFLVVCKWFPAPASEQGTVAAEEESEPADKIRDNAPTTVQEARGRARLLHETLHGTLQVVHRDFFRADEGLKIPSRSLEDVFRELSRSHGVSLHWVAVNTEAMSVDHKPRDQFEKDAVTALRSGKTEFEAVEDDAYRYAGTIRLSAQCLKCHASARSSNRDRAAGLVIKMPLRKQ